MEMYTLDMLNNNSVSLLKQFFDVNSGEQIGTNWRKVYVNSTRGRIEVESEVIEPYATVIFMIWGDKPTVTEE